MNKEPLVEAAESALSYEEWHNTIRHREHGDKLDRDPKGYFAAVELLDRLEKVMGEKV